MSMIDGINAAASGMIAQAQRLNLISSNIANANTVSSSEKESFKALVPVFKTMNSGDAQGVVVTKIIKSAAPSKAMYAPNNPLADSNGYVYGSNVDNNEMAADLISAQASYATDVKVLKILNELRDSTIKAMNN
ncbi:flagellar basal body rod protein FlgC [Photobacterium kishitanii]|uniref:Flagellar basal-body rod protein FlgC n=1 Tax=Photobacterium kishitanii TaxID=318456 RepID=A0A2T3KMW7_9GAMM|nr:flagellar basal body rod protein FlgC [Photobacterium kishitanii]PSV01122.1 flagellar basal body rod protein FlgC [Photobacterium kishitanii]